MKLSVNINKVATLRNARGGLVPDVLLAAKRIQDYGADGITVHPRPDERHITYDDVKGIKNIIDIEFNVEGYPNKEFLKLIAQVKPTQVTLVPDAVDVLTSNAGWDVRHHHLFLQDVIAQIKEHGNRTSIFIDSDPIQIEYSAKTNTDRVELYTESYSKNYNIDPEKAITSYVQAAELAQQFNLGINAGHDLNLDNLNFFAKRINGLLEVSIGHALISDSLYYGLENTVQLYKGQLS